MPFSWLAASIPPSLFVGTTADITFFYLGRAWKWEQQLPPDVRILVEPEKGDITDATNLRKVSHRRKFEFAFMPIQLWGW